MAAAPAFWAGGQDPAYRPPPADGVVAVIALVRDAGSRPRDRPGALRDPPGPRRRTATLVGLASTPGRPRDRSAARGNLAKTRRRANERGYAAFARAQKALGFRGSTLTKNFA